MTYRLKPDPETPSPVSTEKQSSANAAKTQGNAVKPPGRLTSLDAFRGFIMLMLAASGFGIYQLSRTDESSLLWTLLNRESFEFLGFHFEHPPWESNFVPGSLVATEGSPWLKWKVSFWDLIQPAFMFMVGMAMPFSYVRREAQGQSRWKRTAHALYRAFVLVLLGVFLSSTGSDATNWIFPNVLCQIGWGYFFVYLLMGVPRWGQITAFVTLLVGTWIAIHVTPPAFDYVPEEVGARRELGEVFLPPYERWSKNGNLFHEFDTWFLNLFPRPGKGTPEEKAFHYNSGGYTTLNFVPSMATMLLGIFCGQFLLIAPRTWKTFGWLCLAAVLCTALGVFAGATCCPIVKRIWTPSWVLFSGGYVIGMVAIFYLLFDLLPLKRLAFPLVVVGMNSIAVYMMGQLLRGWTYREVVKKHFDWLIERLFLVIQQISGSSIAAQELRELFEPVVRNCSVALVFWLVCFWMYRQRIFIRI